MRKYKSIIGVLVMSLFIFTGCSNNNDTANTADMKLVLGTTSWPTSMFAYLAESQGYFEEEGVEVEIKLFGAFKDSQQAFVGGNLDLLTSPSSDTIAPYSQGSKFQVIMLTDKSLGADGMVAKADIKDVSDLKGKTVATELYSVDHMYLLQLLKKAGMSEKDITLTNMSISDAGTAIMSGNVDAAVVWEPYLSKALSSGDTNLLYSSKDTPDLITDCVIANEETLETKKEAVQGFVNAWYKAVEYWQNNQEDAEKIMAEKMEVTQQEFRDIMSTLYICTPKDAQVALTGQGENSFVSVNTTIAEFLKELDVINTVPNVQEMVTSEFVESLVKEKEGE